MPSCGAAVRAVRCPAQAVSADSSTMASSWRAMACWKPISKTERLRACGATCGVDAATREDAVRIALLKRTTCPSQHSR